MKINVSKMAVCILLTVFSIIIITGGILGFSYWENHFAVQINNEDVYMLGETDITRVVQYSLVADTFKMSMIFTLYGSALGFIVDTVIFAIYVIVHLIRDNTEYFEIVREENKRYKEERKRRIKEHDDLIHQYAEEQRLVDKQRKEEKKNKKQGEKQ